MVQRDFIKCSHFKTNFTLWHKKSQWEVTCTLMPKICVSVCNGVQLIAHERCCRDREHPDGVPYNCRTQHCCGYVVFEKTRKIDNTYYSDEYMCCYGHPVSLDQGDSCCRTRGYWKDTQLCCRNGQVINRPGGGSGGGGRSGGTGSGGGGSPGGSTGGGSPGTASGGTGSGGNTGGSGGTSGGGGAGGSDGEPHFEQCWKCHALGINVLTVSVWIITKRVSGFCSLVWFLRPNKLHIDIFLCRT